MRNMLICLAQYVVDLLKTQELQTNNRQGKEVEARSVWSRHFDFRLYVVVALWACRVLGCFGSRPTHIIVVMTRSGEFRLGGESGLRRL